MKQYMHDSFVIFRRSMTLGLQNPIWVIVSIFQPILYLTLFGPILESIANTPGFPSGNAWQVFVPGLLVQLGIFGSFFVGFGIISDWRSGVIDRMLVTPAHRTALITGRVLRDVIMLSFQAIILLAISFLFGLRISPLAFVAALFLVALLAAAFSYFSYALGLMLKSEDALAPMINSFALPILLLSGILLPMSLAPSWLQILSDINTIKHIVEALRAIFRNDYYSFEAILGVVLALLLIVIATIVGNKVIINQTK